MHTTVWTQSSKQVLGQISLTCSHSSVSVRPGATRGIISPDHISELILGLRPEHGCSSSSLSPVKQDWTLTIDFPVPGPLSGCSFPFLQPPFLHPTAPCLLTFMVVDLFKNLKWFLENVIHAGVCGVDKTCLNIIVPPLFPSSLWIFFFYYNIPLPSVMIVETFACHLILFSPSVSFPLSTELCLTIISPQLSISGFFCSS